MKLGLTVLRRSPPFTYSALRAICKFGGRVLRILKLKHVTALRKNCDVAVFFLVLHIFITSTPHSLKIDPLPLDSDDRTTKWIIRCSPRFPSHHTKSSLVRPILSSSLPICTLVLLRDATSNKFPVTLLNAILLSDLYHIFSSRRLRMVIIAV
jgi:hypothetical protein